MMESYKNKFYDYYHKNLSQGEMDEMNQELKANDQLAQEYGEFNQMLQHLQKREQVNTALQNLTEVSKEYNVETSDTSTQRKGTNWLRVAAVLIPLLLLSAALMYFINSNSSVEGEYIYASNYIAPLINLNARGSNTNDASLQKAVEAYNEGDFATALSGLSVEDAPDQKKSQVALARAISLHETGENDEAIALLNELAMNDEIMESTANWYIAMIQLESEKIDEAKESFARIQNESSYYAKANEILKKLQ